MITDCHVHIEPFHMMKPAVFAAMKGEHKDFARYEAFSRSPKEFLKYLDASEIGRAVLISCVAPETMGTGPEVNAWIAAYAKEAPKRLLPCGSVHPRFTADAQKDMESLLRMGMRLIKIHPPHQLLYANDYLNGVEELETIYRVAEENGVPVMIHTGTSVFPGARNKYGDPIYVDDVAVDFPKLKILIAHGGRPLWMDTAFFLLRRHKNVYLDISSIPPRRLLEGFPRLEMIAQKTLFGTDWPGPGVPEIAANLAEFRELPISDEAKVQITERTAMEIWPT